MKKNVNIVEMEKSEMVKIYILKKLKTVMNKMEINVNFAMMIIS